MRKQAFRTLQPTLSPGKENQNMNKKIALCADSECLRNPSGLGLKGERILDQTWLVAFADALIARQYLREHAVDETWVVSSDSVDGINLAAALKKDNACNNIRLFLSSPSGSNMSRCQNAGIVPICGKGEFAHLYAARKRMNAADSIEASYTPATPSPHVTVQRIERDRTQDTGPLPTVEIEETPIPRSEQSPSLPDIPKRMDFGMAATAPAQTYAPTPTTASAATPTPELTSAPMPVPTHASATTSIETPANNALSGSKPKTLSTTEEGANIVSIVSGSGGTGKSSVSVLTALLAQNKGFRTLILDADLQFGDLQYLLGYKHPLDTSDILMRPEQIETLLKVDTWPALLSAPARLEHSELIESRIAELLGYLKPHFDLIVVNTASFWSDLQIQLLEASNHVFFLLDQRPSSIRACNHALDLCARCGIATTSFSYLLNFCSKRSLLSALDVSCALKGAKVHEIRDGGAEVGELLGAGMAHKLAKLNNPFCASVESLLKETVFQRAKPSLAPTNEPTVATPERFGPTNVKAKLRARQKRRAACF
ncbi:P-loop NTPase [Anaerotardibacter muris]|uniref:P-loop NTPase n=1 Tax=Anaerotardibacter muris TaxID=2941505 RepID=UPI0020418961|nr:P-loop NTPase [Anaerotardibacter muris]